MNLFRIASILIVAVLASTAFASKAPYYLWKSKLHDGKDRPPTCAQTMQGEGEKVGGPFKDSHCKVSGTPD